MVHEVSVDVLESATCCFGIEEIHEWNERSVEDGPDDVELPTERANANWSNLYNDEVACQYHQHQDQSVLLLGAHTEPIRRSAQSRSLVFH